MTSQDLMGSNYDINKINTNKLKLVKKYSPCRYYLPDEAFWKHHRSNLEFVILEFQ